MSTSIERREHARSIAVTLLAVGALIGGALQLAACGNEASAGPSFNSDAGAPDDALPGTSLQCLRAEDCSAHNHICVFGPGERVGHCEPPPDGGSCTPTGEASIDNPTCYPGARCQEVPATQSASGGLCSFEAPLAPLFNLANGAPKISASAPNVLTVLRPADGVQLRWTPPAVPADAITIAVIFKNVPQRQGAINRVSNPSDLLWIWSSTDPGASTRPGTVALESGHRGVTATGELGPSMGTNQLPAGRYWWFVYALRAGAVIATSDVLPFRVGADSVAVSCGTVDDCTRQIPGELPDTVACISGRCRRRCASDLDCPGAGARCDLASTVPGVRDIRRGAFCTAP